MILEYRPEWRLNYYLSAFSWTLGFPIVVKHEFEHVLLPAGAPWQILCTRLFKCEEGELRVHSVQVERGVHANSASIDAQSFEVPPFCRSGDWLFIET